MICDINVFKRIYDLECRHVKRLKNEFVMITIDFNEVELPIPFSEAISKIAVMLRACDAISFSNDKIYLLLQDMSMLSSGIIMGRFNQFCQDLKLTKKPSIDIKEIS